MIETTSFPAPDEAVGATDVLDVDAPSIQAAAARVAGDAEGAEAVRRLFDFVRDEITYNMSPDVEVRPDWTASRTLERGYGFCQQKAVLLSTLLRARGIPAGLVFQDLLDHKIPAKYAEFIGSQMLETHGLTCAFVDGRWVLLDATLDRRLVERKGYRLVEFDGTGDAVLADTDAAGQPHFDVVEELGAWPDMPDEIIDRVMSFEWLHSDEYKAMVRRQGPGM